MPILFRCSCGKPMKAADEHGGRKVRCPRCDAVLTVPAEMAPAEEAKAIALAAKPPVSARPQANRFRQPVERAPVWPWVTGSLFLVLLAAGGIGAYFFFQEGPHGKSEGEPPSTPSGNPNGVNPRPVNPQQVPGFVPKRPPGLDDSPAGPAA
jgi:phage FluMu protein Com